MPSDLEPGTFKCSRKRCNTCPYINNTTLISGPKNSLQIHDHFNCTSTNVIYCIRCTLCHKLYIGETGRKLGDRFREHLLDVKKNNTDRLETSGPTLQSIGSLREPHGHLWHLTSLRHD